MTAKATDCLHIVVGCGCSEDPEKRSGFFEDQGGGFGGQAHVFAEDSVVGLVDFVEVAGLEFVGQEGGAEADSLEAGHGAAGSFPQAADFPVAAFGQCHGVPGVAGGDFAGDDVGKPGRAVVEFHAIEQLPDLFFADRPANPAQVLPVHVAGRVHHAVGQFPVGGQKQQSGGVDVQPAHGNPAGAFQAGQVVEYGLAPFRVGAGGDLALGLVVDQGAVVFQPAGDPPLASVDEDFIAGCNGGTQLGGLTVDCDFAALDARFKRPPGSVAGPGQDFLQAFRGEPGDFSRRACLGFRRPPARLRRPGLALHPHRLVRPLFLAGPAGAVGLGRPGRS